MSVSTFVRRLLGPALVAVLLLATRSQAQTAPAWASVQRVVPAPNSSPQHSQGQSIAMAADGSYYVAGRFGGTLTLGAVTLTAANGMMQLYLAKYSVFGAVVWATQLAAASGIVNGKVAVDATGSVYLAGSFGTSLTLGATVLTSPGQDAFLVKYDAQGVQQWVQQGGPYASADGLAFDAGGNVTVVGFCGPAVSFGGVALSGGGLYAYTFSPAGTALRATRVGTSGSGHVFINDMAQDGAGNVYLVGRLGGTMVLGTTTLTSNANSDDLFVCKLDAAGALAWARSEGGPDRDEARDVAVDAAGNLLVGGYCDDTSLATSTNKVYIARFTTQGTPLWSRLLATSGPTPNENMVYSVAYDGRGGCLALGAFVGNLVFGLTTLTNPLPALNQLFVARYDAQGTAVWASQTLTAVPAANTGFAAGLGMAVDAGGNAYICGAMGGTEIFGAVISVPVPSVAADYSAFVAKLTAGGTLTATRPTTGLALQAYPNPATGLTTLTLPTGGGQLEVLDVLGRRVHQQNLPATAGPCAVPLNGLAPGLYQLRAVLGNGQSGHATLQVE